LQLTLNQPQLCNQTQLNPTQTPFHPVGAAADHGSLRKTMLLVTGFLGAFFTALVLPLGGEDSLWWVVGLLTVLSNVCYGSSIVFYNAYLPLLVAAHPSVLELRASGARREELSAKEESVANEISTHGFAAGYASGLGLLIVVIALVLVMGTESTLSVRLGVFLSGVWWAVFTLYTAKHLTPRPGPPLPEGASYVTYGWRRFFATVRHARKLPDTFAFLVSYFLTSDAVSTVSTVGILFAREELGLGTGELLIVALLVPIFALIGNYAYLHAQRRLGWSSKKTYIFVLFMIALIPTYAFCGFFAPFGLVQPWEIYIFAIFFGFHVGIVQSLSRVIYSELIPPSMESSFFSLYEITDRGSSWIGPLGVAALRDATGESRWKGMFFCFCVQIEARSRFLILLNPLFPPIIQSAGDCFTCFS
jgi:UMF1 family MFS transporter